MSFATPANTIRSAFQVVATAESLTVQYDNAPPITKPDNAIWVRLTIEEVASELRELGSGKSYRNQGLMVVAIYAPLHVGDGAARALADTIASSFRSITYTGVRFRTPRIIRSGPVSDSKWWMLNLFCPFHFDYV